MANATTNHQNMTGLSDSTRHWMLSVVAVDNVVVDINEAVGVGVVNVGGAVGADVGECVRIEQLRSHSKL
jgi:hypothetical protein